MKNLKKITVIIATVLLAACSSTPSEMEINQSEDILLTEDNLPLIIAEEAIQMAKSEILKFGGYDTLSEIDVLEEEKAYILTNNIINFDFDSYELSDKGIKNVKKHIDFLKKYNTIRIIVEGHTDDRGEKSYNLNLGEKRALSVKKFMTDNGIEEKRVEVVSLGEAIPKNSEGTKKAWKENRRSVFIYN